MATEKSKQKYHFLYGKGADNKGIEPVTREFESDEAAAAAGNADIKCIRVQHAGNTNYVFERKVVAPAAESKAGK